MTDSEADQKPRKSVAFSEGAMVVDANGKVTETATENKNGDDAAVDEVTDMFAGLAKKKKKPSKKKEEGEGEGDLDGLDMSGLKKKKKKKPKAEDAGEGGEDEEKPVEVEEDGDMILGTGVWEHDRTESIRYNPLLDRFFALLHDRNPDLAAGAGKNYKIPPPQCLREGNKKTIFANLPEIAKRLKRSEEHLTQFLFAEMGTSGSTDGSRRLVIKGRFQSKQIENILRRYIQDYVSCKTCRSLNTELAKGENRLWYLSCQSCGSTRTVPAIKTGFSAQIGKRKRMQT